MSHPPLTSVRLQRNYDVDRLLADLEAAKSFEPVSQPGPYHNGEWKGVSLHAVSGDIGWAGTHRSILETFEPTPALAKTPYFAEILEPFEWKQSVRVLSLPPGGRIGEHRDFLPIERGTIRLHVPLVTHPDVVFMLGGERQRWAPGQLWYGDFALPHSVENHSPLVRYHLVIDTGLTPYVVDLFPPEVLARLQQEGRLPTFSTRIRLDPPQRDLYQCRFTMPPLKQIPELRAGFEGSIRVIDDDLRVMVGTRPAFRLIPIGHHSFYIDSFGPETIIRFQVANDRIHAFEITQRRRGDAVASVRVPVDALS